MSGVNMPQGEQKTSLADIASVVKTAWDMKQGAGGNKPPTQQKTPGTDQDSYMKGAAIQRRIDSYGGGQDWNGGV